MINLSLILIKILNRWMKVLTFQTIGCDLEIHLNLGGKIFGHSWRG